MRQWWWLCIRFFDRRLRRPDVEQPATSVQLLLPMTIGKKSIMTNAVETLWQGVKQETADELIAIERHDILFAAVAIILPSERDTITIDVDEAGIGDCDTVCVASEIGQYLFGSRKWGLGIDHPVDAPHVFNGAIECSGIGQTRDIAEEPKLTLIVDLLEFFQKQPPKQP